MSTKCPICFDCKNAKYEYINTAEGEMELFECPLAESNNCGKNKAAYKLGMFFRKLCPWPKKN